MPWKESSASVPPPEMSRTARARTAPAGPILRAEHKNAIACDPALGAYVLRVTRRRGARRGVESRDAPPGGLVKQIAAVVPAFAAVVALLASAPRPAAAMGPMAGTVRVAEMGRLVSPES